MCDNRQRQTSSSPLMDQIEGLPAFVRPFAADNDRPAIERFLQFPPADESVIQLSSTPTIGATSVDYPATSSPSATPSTPSLVFSSPTMSSPSLQTPISSVHNPVYELPNADYLPMISAYRCLFEFLGCKFVSLSTSHWIEHNGSHIPDRKPRSLQCPYCPKSGSDPVEYTWSSLLDHVLAHYSAEATFSMKSVPDSKLIDCLWRNKVVTPDQKKELDVDKCLNSEGEAYLLTQGNRQDGKRTRRDTRPRRVVVQNGYDT